MEEAKSLTIKDIVFELTPEIELKDIILDDNTRSQILEVVDEQFNSISLHSHNLRARNRILIRSSPGNGKSLLAKALATQLMCPLIVVRYEMLVGGCVIDTLNNVKKLFDYIATQRCVVLFDNVETISLPCGMFNTLTFQLKNMPDYVVIVATASNAKDILNGSFCSLFQLQVELDEPNLKTMEQFIDLMSARCCFNFDYRSYNLAILIDEIGVLSFGEVEEFCLDVIRTSYLSGSKDGVVESIVDRKLKQWTKIGD